MVARWGLVCALRTLARADQGSVTTEFALTLPAVVVVLGLALSAGAWILEVEAAQRAVGAAARVAAVGTDAEGLAAGATVAPGHRFSVTRNGSIVTVCTDVAVAPWPRVTRCAAASNR